MTAPLFTNPVLDLEGVDHGDPFVLRHGERYFLYHSGDEGVPVHVSTDLVDWSPAGMALDLGQEGGTVQAWAPEVLHHDGLFHMYVATTTLTPAGEPDDSARRMRIASSDAPEGPFRLRVEPLVGDEWSIDGHPFQAPDGSRWLFYNVRNEATRYPDGTVGCGNVVVRMAAVDRLVGEPEPVVRPTERWEGNESGSWYWTEGAWVLHRREWFVQLYSGGFFGDHTYGIGSACAPAPNGPWTKHTGNPIFRSGERITGPGHNSVVVAPDGVTPYVVYHGHVRGRRGRKVHLDRLRWCGDAVVIGPGLRPPTAPTEGPQPIPPVATYDPMVPHWHAELWVGARSIRLGAKTVDVPGEGLRRVEVSSGPEGVVVHCGPIHLFSGPSMAASALADVLGPITLTSHMEDQRLHHLAAGERIDVPWGGTHAVAVELAVHGDVEVRIGRDREIAASPNGFSTFRMESPSAAEQVEIAASTASMVTDLVVRTLGS